MRDIKFRAWDKNEKAMVYSEKVPFEYDFSINESGNLVCSVNCCYCDTFGDEHDDWNELDNIMQYTGRFTDKKTDIYEGDIFRIHNDVVVIKWLGSAFYPCRRKNSNEFNKVTTWSIVVKNEPIGNVYQNPELLEARP